MVIRFVIRASSSSNLDAKSLSLYRPSPGMQEESARDGTFFPCNRPTPTLHWQEFRGASRNFPGEDNSDEKRRRRRAVDERSEEGHGLNALGRHLLLELFDCDFDAINNLETVKNALVEAAKRAHATIVDVVFHEFNPFGISGVVVIAESHLSIHTWPEHRYAAVDIFSCGDALKPEVAANYLVEQFGAERTSVVELQRGMFLNAPAPVHNKTPLTVP
jgi:S-adenosylmethionine decarboxylase